MIKDIVLYSPIALEKWDWTTIDTTGIGGSETAHVVMAKIFGDLMFDHNIYSVAPCDRIKLGPGGVQWFPLSQKDILLKDNTPKIWLIFRDPFFFDQELSKDSKYYFIAQDVDYPWTEEGLSRVDKYICLCKEHAKYTAGRYPKIKDKIYISTNGIRSDYIRKFIKENDSVRKMKRLIYSSSPDRGLELILDNFWRITERHPDVKLDVYYGFNNLEKIAKNNKDTRLQNLHNKLIQKQQELKEWVTFHGRISQPQLYKEMLTSSVWFYPSDWPETSPVAGNTLISTLEGDLPIKDLLNKEFYVYSCNAAGKLSISTAKNVKCTRKNAKTVRITFRHERGNLSKTDKYLVLTPDHEVLLADGTYVPAGELKKGDRIKHLSRRKNEFGVGYDTLAVTDEPAVPEHRFVAEFFAGRKLKKGEVVDHINRDKKDNRPSNLVIYKNQAAHQASHFSRMSISEYKEFCGLKALEYKQKAELYGEEWMKSWHQKGAYASAGVRYGTNHKVEKVEEWESQDVYCMEVEPDHNFAANGIFVHNCITSMEMQACGVYPILNKFWAQGENVFNGILIDGVPQKDILCKTMLFKELNNCLEGFEKTHEDFDRSFRNTISEDALDSFDWNKVAKQYMEWFKNE